MCIVIFTKKGYNENNGFIEPICLEEDVDDTTSVFK